MELNSTQDTTLNAAQDNAAYTVLADDMPETGYEVEHFEPLARSEEKHFWFNGRNLVILQSMAKHIPSMTSFMEVGCGTGYVLSAIEKAYPQAELAASDYFGEALEFAHQRVPDAALYQVDARDMPFEAQFDVVGAFDVIEHIAEDKTVLEQMAKALKPSGYLILTVPHHKSLWTITDKVMGHHRRYSLSELRDKVEGVGFEVVYTTAFVSLLSPVIFASRYAQQLRNTSLQTMDDAEVSPVLNRILYSVMQVETQLLKVGMRFSVGGSRLMIARKTS